MELTTHKLRISQSTVNTILSRAQGHYKSILLSAGADEMIFKTKNLECPWCAGVPPEPQDRALPDWLPSYNLSRKMQLLQFQNYGQ